MRVGMSYNTVAPFHNPNVVSEVLLSDFAEWWMIIHWSLLSTSSKCVVDIFTLAKWMIFKGPCLSCEKIIRIHPELLDSLLCHRAFQIQPVVPRMSFHKSRRRLCLSLISRDSLLGNPSAERKAFVCQAKCHDYWHNLPTGHPRPGGSLIFQGGRLIFPADEMGYELGGQKMMQIFLI